LVSVAVKVGVILGIAEFDESFKVMVTVEVAIPFAVTLPVPVMLEVKMDGAPGENTTVPPAREIGEVNESVFVSGWVEVNVQVDTPLVVVDEHIPYPLVVPVLVALKVGTVPFTGLLFTSKSVMVMVEAVIPSDTTGPEPRMVVVEIEATS
jgi:hypothetical protein